MPSRLQQERKWVNMTTMFFVTLLETLVDETGDLALFGRAREHPDDKLDSMNRGYQDSNVGVRRLRRHGANIPRTVSRV